MSGGVKQGGTPETGRPALLGAPAEILNSRLGQQRGSSFLGRGEPLGRFSPQAAKKSEFRIVSGGVKQGGAPETGGPALLGAPADPAARSVVAATLAEAAHSVEAVTVEAAMVEAATVEAADNGDTMK